MGESRLEPSTRFASIVSYREALATLWGADAVARVASALPDDAAATLRAAVPLDTWIPERHVVALGEAVWEWPCGRDVAAFHAWVDRMIDGSFGRARRVLIALANPPMLLRRAPELWRDDHTHGTLGYVPLAVDAARITLRDHPYVESPVQRAAFTEAARYAMSLCRVTVHAEAVPAPPGAFAVLLQWA